MNHKIYEYLLLKVMYFLSKGYLNIPKHKRLLIGCVLQLYTMEPVIENIAFSSL